MRLTLGSRHRHPDMRRERHVRRKSTSLPPHRKHSAANPYIVEQVLHGLHHRHLRPWELFTDDVEDDRFASTNDLNKLENLDSFGGGSNSYEDQPWVARYEKRNVVRKIFDREVWVQEPALRQIQDTIFLQSMLMALAGTAVVTAVFCALPSGNRY